MKEWSMSKCTPLSLERLVRIGVLHAQELAGWRAPDLEPFPDPKEDEIIVFEEYFTHGFGVPIHPFLQGLCNYYEISICNLHPNSVLLITCFIHLYEAYDGFQPHFDYFRHLFWLKKKQRLRRLQCGWWLLSKHAGRDQGRVPTLPLENHTRGLV
jgi:hypothetical protein